MAMRIERLRVWLLVSAALLLVVIAGFIGTARYLRRHWMAGLPAKLGVDVKIDTSGITLSHTYQGQTDYVVHAAKDLEHSDGTYELHDVWMKVCGRQQQRADMIRGDDWEWDQKAQVVRAKGVVHIELRDAANKSGCTAVDDSATSGAKAMQVTTSNLVYMEKLGVAATSAPIEFASGAMEGHAVGADYADNGVLMLHSAVSMKGMSAGEPVTLDAASAELDGQERVARLTGAKYTTGAGSTARTATAEQAVLHLRGDQTLERIEAQGNVTLQADGGTVMAAKADIAMNAAGHPLNALLNGGVRYVANTPLAERHGEAEQAAITFDGKASPQAQHAVFTGAAHFTERAPAGDAKGAWNTRDLTAAKLDLVLAPGADGRNEVRDAEATGGARFSEADAEKGAAGGETTEISADDLKAHFAASGASAGSRPELETIAGRGHTLVRQVSATGVEQTSAGDVLDARFRQSGPVKKGAAKGGEPGGVGDVDALASAVQTGHVVVTRRGAKGAKSDGLQEARAQEATYDGETDRVTLNGGVQLTDPDGAMWADQVVMERATGNAVAAGGVKAQYVQATQHHSGQDDEPAHVLAERAELNHATDVVTFHGAPARMWQGGSQVQAPVIEIARTAKRLIARSEAAAGMGAMQVHTVLMNAGAGAGQTSSTTGGARPCAANASAGNGRANGQGADQPQAVRVASGGLVYSQASDEVDFTGGFRAETADATIRANAGTVYLDDDKGGAKPGGAVQTAAAQGVPSLEGHIDHVTASGQVTVDRPGLRATGERLLYTEADQSLLLTGDAKSPPRAVDAQGNQTTGAALKFHRACDGTRGDTVETVEVLSTVPGEPGGPSGGVHTEVRADAKRVQPVQ